MLKHNWDQVSESYPLRNPLKLFPNKINYVITFVETKKWQEWTVYVEMIAQSQNIVF